MITFKPLWETLSQKGISTYKLEHEFKMSKSTINKLRHNKSITLNTLNDLCNKFECGIADIIDYVPDEIGFENEEKH